MVAAVLKLRLKPAGLTLIGLAVRDYVSPFQYPNKMGLGTLVTLNGIDLHRAQSCPILRV